MSAPQIKQIITYSSPWHLWIVAIDLMINKNIGILKMQRFQGSAAFLKAAREWLYTFIYNPGYFCVLLKLLNKFYHVLCLKVSALSKNKNQSHEVAPVTSPCIHTVCSQQQHNFLVLDLLSSARFASPLKRFIRLDCSRSLLAVTLHNIPKSR